MRQDSIGFIGGGNMTSAIAAGLLDNGYRPELIAIADPVAEQREKLAAAMPGVLICAVNADVVARSDYLVLSVKPQVLAAVCKDIAAAVQASKPVIISIAAGPRIDDIDTWLGGGNAVVRVMPNQPALLGKGISGIFGNATTREAQMQTACDILSAIGPVVTVDKESDIDAVTAVSGSGPAYFYLLIDMLAKTGAELGLPPAAAAQLARETALGAATLARESGESMDELIARVRSPGGTTAAALDALEAGGVRDIFASALLAARNRATELADAAHESGKD